MTSNEQIGRCAVILVGDGDDPNLQGIAHIMKRREVPFLNAVGIVEAVDRVADWIAYANQREPSTASIPVTTVDFVGHAAQGRFFFGNDPKHVLSSCPDSYCRLEKLRKLVHAPSDIGLGSRWGLRLIGCDVANDEFVGDPYVVDNGTVLQFALSWFLQMPVWAPRGPIFGRHFDNPAKRVRFEDLQEVSAAASPKVPRRMTHAEYMQVMQDAFATAVVGAPSVPVPESFFTPEFYEYDFSKPRDASELMADISRGDAVVVPQQDGEKFTRAFKIFGGKVLIAELAESGRRIAYLRNPPAPIT